MTKEMKPLEEMLDIEKPEDSNLEEIEIQDEINEDNLHMIESSTKVDTSFKDWKHFKCDCKVNTSPLIIINDKTVYRFLVVSERCQEGVVDRCIGERGIKYCPVCGYKVTFEEDKLTPLSQIFEYQGTKGAVEIPDAVVDHIKFLNKMNKNG